MVFDDFLVQPYAFVIPAYKGIRQYTFINNQNVHYSVQFVQKKNDFTDFLMDLSVFNNEDEYETVNDSAVFRKMSTVIHILHHFIENNLHCKQIEFTPVSETNIHINRREHLFERYIRGYTKSVDWKYKIINHRFILTKK